MRELLQQSEIAHRLNGITQRIGFTLWQIQELEGVSAQYLVLVVQAKKGMGQAAGSALIEKAQKQTLGTIIKQLVKARLLSSEMETCFTKLLKKRNWLVHKSRADSRSAIHSDVKMQQLIDKIDKIAEESLSLQKKIGGITEEYVMKHGVSKEYINNEAKKLLEQWHTPDAI